MADPATFNQMQQMQQQQFQLKEDRLNAINQELATRRDAQYTPYSYPGYPYGMPNVQQMQNPSPYPPQNMQNQIPQNEQMPIQQQAEPQKPKNEYLQGHPIEREDQLHDVIVGLDGRVSIFPFFAENAIYTKNLNIDGLPEYKRYILDDSFEMKDETTSNNTQNIPDLAPVLAQLETLQAEIREELQALREERKNGTTSEPVPASDSASNDKGSKSNATSATTAKPKSRDAASSGAANADAKG